MVCHIKSAILNLKNFKFVSAASKTPRYGVLNYQTDIKIRALTCNVFLSSRTLAFFPYFTRHG